MLHGLQSETQLLTGSRRRCLFPTVSLVERAFVQVLNYALNAVIPFSCRRKHNHCVQPSYDEDKRGWLRFSGDRPPGVGLRVSSSPRELTDVTVAG